MVDNDKVCVRICMGSSCFSRGNKKTLSLIKEYVEQNDLDQKVEIVGSLCEGQCSSGPHIIVNEQRYDNITPETAIDIIRDKAKGKG